MDRELPGQRARARSHGLSAALTGVGEHHRGCFAVNSITALASADGEVPQIADDLLAGIEDAFAAAIRRGQNDNELDARRDPQRLASTLLGVGVGVGVVVGVGVLAQTGDGTARSRRILDSAIDDL